MPGPFSDSRGSRRSGPVPPVQGSLFAAAVELGDSPLALSDPQLAISRKKIISFGIFVLCWGVIVFSRLVFLQVVRHSFFEEKARQQQQRTIELRASRGLILDSRGRELAISVPVDSICAMPAEISDPEELGTLLARILNLPRQELIRKLSARHGFCWIARMVEPELADRVRALNRRGIYFQKESKRFYPKGETAAHLIGAVGLDQTGLAGIEQAREDELEGRPGLMEVSTDARQRQFAGRLKQQPDPGANVILTIDERIQYVAERELNAAIGRTGAAAGSVVVLNPKTGALLGIANYPTFNPNVPVRSSGEAENRRNYAISSSFEPGSTFKLITLAGALEEKLTRPDEVVDCQMGSIIVAGHRIRDHKPFGRLTVEQILVKSSDVGAIKMGMRLGDDRMYQYMRRFGLGQRTGIELPGEARGLTKPPARWSKISIGAISMGQEVGVTALQLVQAVGTIANGGVLVPPHLVEATYENGGKPVPVQHPPSRRVISPETAVALKHMMELVVLDGTGKLARLEGYTAGGKTGTAQKVDPRTGAYSKTNFVASFVGIAPLNDPAIVVAVILDSPRGMHMGGSVSAPVFPRVAEEVLRYLQVPQEVPIDPALRRRRANGSQPDPKLLAEVTDFTPDNGLPGAPLDEGDVKRPSARLFATAARPVWQQRPFPVTAQVPLQRPAGAPILLAVSPASMPDFAGKPLREVVEEATAIGLAVDLRGNGLARRQSPPPGSPLLAGSRIRVEFEQ